mgnify:CR=1 FL=1
MVTFLYVIYLATLRRVYIFNNTKIHFLQRYFITRKFRNFIRKYPIKAGLDLAGYIIPHSRIHNDNYGHIPLFTENNYRDVSHSREIRTLKRILYNQFCRKSGPRSAHISTPKYYITYSGWRTNVTVSQLKPNLSPQPGFDDGATGNISFGSNSYQEPMDTDECCSCSKLRKEIWRLRKRLDRLERGPEQAEYSVPIKQERFDPSVRRVFKKYGRFRIFRLYLRHHL